MLPANFRAGNNSMQRPPSLRSSAFVVGAWPGFAGVQNSEMCGGGGRSCVELTDREELIRRYFVYRCVYRMCIQEPRI